MTLPLRPFSCYSDYFDSSVSSISARSPLGAEPGYSMSIYECKGYDLGVWIPGISYKNSRLGYDEDL